VYHPDKLEQGSKEHETFKSIQEAYEVLMNEEKRRDYDSLEPFDDSLPKGKEPTELFFKVYGGAFENNAKFSISKEVPKLGSENTSITEVFAFYDWWYKVFQSWRTFPDDDEFDLSRAESKEEKRWMKVQNEKRRKKMKQEEHSRIVKLIDLAYKKDPRIVAHVKQQQEEKERKKKERKDQQQLRKKQEEEERRKQQEEEKEKKENRKKRNKRKKENKKPNSSNFNISFVSWLKTEKNCCKKR